MCVFACFLGYLDLSKAQLWKARTLKGNISRHRISTLFFLVIVVQGELMSGGQNWKMDAEFC